MLTVFLIGVALNVAMAFWVRSGVNDETLRLPIALRDLNWKGFCYNKIAWDNQEQLRLLAIETYVKIVIIYSALMFCIATLGGAIAAEWIIFVSTFQLGKIGFCGILFANYFFAVLPVLIIYIGQYSLLKLSNFRRIYTHAIFVLTYLVSILFWNRALQ